jgi:glycosyltransferase involved in cell wall biosynthesis
MKKTVLHIIHNLGRGGAETMLVKVVKELHDYNNIVVTLFPKNHFGDELVCDKYYCLDIGSILQLPLAIPRLKKIIKENNVDIVHSHLFWPTVLARMAVPKKIPLITTIHAFIATSVEYKIPYIKYLDKLTYKLRKSVIITVAKGALDEYFNFLKLKPYRSFALYTFVDTRIFNTNNTSRTAHEGTFKLVSVGALRKQKNYSFLLEAFRYLDNSRFQLDIYGEGPLQEELQNFINEHKINVRLMGEVRNIQTRLNDYDLYIMSSTFEGFSLSVLEAMAMKMPLLVSDISSFREQCGDTAQYYNLGNTDDVVAKLKAMKDASLVEMGEAAYKRVVNNFTLEHHMDGLRKIYSDVLDLTSTPQQSISL